MIQVHEGLIQCTIFSQILFNLLVEYETVKIESRAYVDYIIWIWPNYEHTKQVIQIMKS